MEKTNKNINANQTIRDLERALNIEKLKLRALSVQFMSDHVQETIYKFYADNEEYRTATDKCRKQLLSFAKSLDKEKRNELFELLYSLNLSISFLLSEIFREGVRACNVYGETLEFSNYLQDVNTTTQLYTSLPYDL